MKINQKVLLDLYQKEIDNIYEVADWKTQLTPFGIIAIISKLIENTPSLIDKETVTISKKEYDRLIEDSEFLTALEAAGVDNWEGYAMAREMVDADEVTDNELI